MQTILGSGGVIGEALSRQLPPFTERIRQVSRTPRRVNRTDEVMAADLLDAVATSRAVEGSEVAYLTAGLPYDAEIWERDWPRIMDNAIEACRRHSTRLVFLDNVYAYGRVRGPMTEDTPFNPCSQKGEVRARIATTLLEAMAAGEVEAMIVRSADFYGPGAESSMVHHTVFQRIESGKPPRWIGNPKAAHSFSFTEDVARSLALLGNRPEAYGRSWHALTDGEEMSGIRFVETACEAARVRYELQTIPSWLLWAMGLVNPVLRENREMMYQFDYNYRFDSSAIQEELEVEPTPYAQGIAKTLGAIARTSHDVFLPRRIRE